MLFKINAFHISKGGENSMSYMQPLHFYTTPSNNPLRFYILEVGEGLMILLIFPDNSVMLYDCNVRNDDEELILNFLSNNIPLRYNNETDTEEKWIDIYVNSHRDLDHYRGLYKVNNQFSIKSIWDSGQTGATTQDDDYKYYMGLRRRLVDKYGDKALFVPTPTSTPIRVFGDAKVYCLSSSKDYIEESAQFKVKIQHTNSIVLSIEYSGRRLLLTSDSDWNAWRDKIVPNFNKLGILKSDILIASHHGSRSFFTDEVNENIDPDANPDSTYIDSIYCINPSITLISCGKYDEQHHPNKEALEIYKTNTAFEQVYTTYEKGTFCGFIDKYGNWTVVPSRFKERNMGAIGFNISCNAVVNGSEKNIPSNHNLPVGASVIFTIDSYGGLIEPSNMIDIWWEVSNGGINHDNQHQEIYKKGENEKGTIFTFSREITYVGRHLLRCRIRNRKKGVDVTRIFVVNGVL